LFNVAAIFIGIIYICVRFFKRRFYGCIFVIASTFISGCGGNSSPTVTNNVKDSSEFIDIEPLSIDYGVVAASTGALSSHIEVSNPSDNESISVKLISGCVCTTTSVSDIVIQPNGRATIPIFLLTAGRQGVVTSGIVVKWSRENGVGSFGSVDIPIEASVTRDIYSQPTKCLLAETKAWVHALSRLR